MEIELKYKVDPERGREIIESECPGETDKDRTIPMDAIYYDTKDSALRERHITYRIRREGDKYVLTVKYGKGSDKAKNGLHRREEINVPVGNDFIDKPGIDVLEDTRIYRELDKAVGGQYSDDLGVMLPVKALKPVIEMRFVRKEIDIYLDEQKTSTAVLSYDEGEILAGGRKEAISEIEIELSEGNEEKLIEFGAFLSKKYNLEEGNKSKYARGLKLLDL